MEEADESVFWLEMLNEEVEIKDQPKLDYLLNEGEQLTKIFAASRKGLEGGSGKF